MICTRCLYDDTIPGITFDNAGVCSYCHLHDKMDKEYPTGQLGSDRLQGYANQIKKDGRGKQFDCIVGISGGCDSSYTLMTAVNYGLRPLAVHFDNGWDTCIAKMNMRGVTAGLKVQMLTHTVDSQEFDSIIAAFLRSGARDVEAATDLGIIATLNTYAEKFGVKYTMNGHSFRTEGIAPMGWSYQDARYVADVCRRYGGPRQFTTYPALTLTKQIRWSMMGIQRIRPLWYIDYDKEEVKKELADKFGWQWYGGHHLESDITAFFMWMAFYRWGIDFRKLGWSALIRSGQMSREEGLKQIVDLTTIEPSVDLFTRINARFGKDGMPVGLDGPKRTEKDFRTYKRTFELLRPLFWYLYKRGNVPHSFYLKYCMPRRKSED